PDAPAGDPLNCGAQSCTLVLDLRSKAAAVRPSPQTFVLASASPDDHGFLVNPAVDGRSLVAVLGDGAPTFASVPFAQTVFGIGRSGRAALLLSTATFPVFPVVADLASGTTTAVSFLDNNSSAPPLDPDGDFVIREGIAHLDTGTIEA